jgi:hypothetical protein
MGLHRGTATVEQRSEPKGVFTLASWRAVRSERYRAGCGPLSRQSRPWERSHISTDRALPGFYGARASSARSVGSWRAAGSPGSLALAAKPALMGTIGHKGRALHAPLVTRARGADVMPGRETCLDQRLHGRIVAARAATLSI